MTRMRQMWMIAVAIALLAVAGAILLNPGASQAEPLQTDFTVTKTVDKAVAAPGDLVVYTLVLSNSSATTATVAPLVDTLPPGFVYGSLTSGSQWLEEPTVSLPEVRWEGPITVSAASSLTLRYSVAISDSLPLSGTPYTNVVSATVGGETYSAGAAVLVGLGEVSLTKGAAPLQIQPGSDVTFTLAFSNSGYVTVPLQIVTDVLPAELSFVGMTAASDVTVSPVGVTGTITWTGPFTIPAHAEFTVEFRATTPVTSDTLTLENRAWGRLGDGTVLSDSVGIEVRDTTSKTVFLPLVAYNYAPPSFSVTKSADPTSVFGEEPGGLITYEVVFSNEGTLPGVLADIRDTLPPGFTFQQMLPGSDVVAAPAGTQGEITWTGPFTVDGRSSLKLIYQVRAATAVGTYPNSVTATVTEGRPPQGPATATVEVKEPFLLLEDFENSSPYWEPFLNNWRLREEQWYLMGGGSYNGSTALVHSYWRGVSNPEKGAHDALYMYQNPEAEQWTDYVYQVRAILKADDGSGRGQFGVWFRGTVDQSEDQLPGRYVTGYYFSLKPSPTKSVILMQMRTDEECGDDCNYNYHFSNPIVIDILKGREALGAKGLDLELNRWYWLRVEVEGPRIRCYIDDILVFDYYDDIGTTFTTGTVGFYTYIAGDARFDNVSVKPLK